MSSTGSTDWLEGPYLGDYAELRYVAPLFLVAVVLLFAFGGSALARGTLVRVGTLANVEGVGLSKTFFEEETKTAVLYCVPSDIGKTTENIGRALAHKKRLIQGSLLEANCGAVPARSAQAKTDWVDDFGGFSWRSDFASGHVLRNSKHDSRVFHIADFNEGIKERGEFSSWFAPGVLIVDFDFPVFFDGGLRRFDEFSLIGANPRPCASNRTILCSFRLFLERLVRSGHFAELPSKDKQGRGHQTDGYPVSKFLAGILTLFFLSIGAALFLYGVNKSREIGGWAFWIVAGGIVPFWGGLWIFFARILGWDL